MREQSRNRKWSSGKEVCKFSDFTVKLNFEGQLYSYRTLSLRPQRSCLMLFLKALAWLMRDLHNEASEPGNFPSDKGSSVEGVKRHLGPPQSIVTHRQ